VRLGLDGNALWETSEPAPILFIDLKGDLALFNAIREECLARGQTFRFCTLEAGRATSYFNPLENLRATPRPVIELCEIVLNMLDLYHGLFYGGGYYSEQARNLLLKTLKVARKPPASWEELYELLTQTLDRREHRDVFELVGRIFALAQYPVLGPAPRGVDAIHMPSVLEKNECVLLWLPALESAMSVVGVAKMALFCFLDAARKWNQSGRPLRPAYAFLDEGQVICGPNIERIFQQATGARMRIILSNQSLANLDARDAPHLSRTIWVNTRVKQTFGLLDSRERRDWIELSGEELGHLRSYADSWSETSRRPDGGTSTTTATTITRHEVVHPRLNQNMISAVNNVKGASLLYLNGDEGLAEMNCIPRQIWCPYPMPQADYVRRSTTPWPALPETNIQSGETTVVNVRAPEVIEREAKEKYAALEELFVDVARRAGRIPGVTGD
jgi:hypothetical protein